MAHQELLGELNGYLNVALCIPQLLVSLLGGAVISIVARSRLAGDVEGCGWDVGLPWPWGAGGFPKNLGRSSGLRTKC